jgi:breakpoint cluster region protein
MLELLHSLPEANYYTIVFMIEHLVRIAKKSPVNKMSQSNLATIFGPTLMHPAMKDTHTDPMVQMAQAAKDASVQSEVVYFFIKLAASGKNIRKSATIEKTAL